MQYQCMSCDARFRLEDGEPLRCPTCMRQHGIEPLEEVASRGAGVPGRRWWWVTGAVVAVTMAGLGAYWLSRPLVLTGEPPLRPLSGDERHGYLRGLGYDGETAGSTAVLGWLAAWEPSSELVTFVQESTRQASGPRDKAEALMAALRGSDQAQQYRWRVRSEPREHALQSPSEVLRALRDGERDHQLYPLEVATLAVVGLRAVGVPALLAEVYAYPDEKQPADPSGRLGYYVVALLDAEGQAAYLDVFGGRERAPDGSDVTLLTDLQALGAALAVEALHHAVEPRGVGKAMEAAAAAVKLAPRSPSVRAARAMVLLAGGGVEDGRRELEAALQIRPDGPRRVQLAAVYIAQGDVDRASREVAKALTQFPEDAAAHAALASIYLMRREHGLAQRALEDSQRHDPELAVLPTLWASLHMAQGDVERARARAEEAVERRPQDLQGRMLLARIYRQLDKYDAMRRQAHAMLARVPPAQREDMRRTLEAMLGPTALDEPLDLDAVDEDVAPSPLPRASQRLRLDSKLLDTTPSNDPAPEPVPKASAPEPVQQEGNDPLLMLGDPSKLKLRDDGARLKLDLEP